MVTRLRSSRVPALLAVVALALGLVHAVPSAVPRASADHQYSFWHWFSSPRYSQVVPPIIDRNRTFRDNVNIPSAAGDFWWSATTFMYGPFGSQSDGRGAYDCSLVIWKVVVCLGEAPPGSNPPPNWTAVNQTYNWWDQFHGNHAAACVIRIRPAWANTHPTTQQLHEVFRHELGHCGGLGHTASSSSVMYYAGRACCTTLHDRQAMDWMYRDHWH